MMSQKVSHWYWNTMTGQWGKYMCPKIYYVCLHALNGLKRSSWSQDMHHWDFWIVLGMYTQNHDIVQGHIRCHTSTVMTKCANQLNICHQTFYKEVLHALNDLTRNQKAKICIFKRLGLNPNIPKLILHSSYAKIPSRINVGTFLRNYISSE